MAALRVYTDFALPEAEAQLIRDGVAPHEMVFSLKPAGSALAQAQADPVFETADVAFGQPAPEAALASKRLRWIHVSSAGYTRYDTDHFRTAAQAKGLLVTNSSSVYADPCADQAFAFMLAQSRHLPAALQARYSHVEPEWWQLRDSFVPLRGSRVLLLGFGAIGRRLAELLRPYGVRITALRRKASSQEGISFITEEQLPAALGEADHVVDLLPASAATEKFLSAERFAQMAPGAAFYNIGRGTTVDQEALLGTLRSGRLGAAWLDVTDPEPLPDDHPLRREGRCYITPHIAGGFRREIPVLVQHFVANFRRFLAGEALRDRVI